MDMPYEEYKKLVEGPSGQRMVYGIDLRRMRRMGLSPAAAVQYAEENKLFHKPAKVELGRPQEIGVRKRPMLTHETILRRLADANADCCRKLLKHRMDEDDLAMVRKLKAQCEDIYLSPRPDKD